MSEESQNNAGDRLDRLEANVDRFIDFVGRSQREFDVRLQSLEQRTFDRFAQVSDALFNLTDTVGTLAGTVGQLTEQVNRLTERTDQILDRIDEMQSEIRGLQTENRRTLELLERRLPPEPES